jgi:hypothetical protein
MRNMQQGEGNLMLAYGEVALPHDVRRNANQQRTGLAHDRIKIPPGFQLRNAVRKNRPRKKLITIWRNANSSDIPAMGYINLSFALSARILI